MTHTLIYRSYTDSFLSLVTESIQPQTGFLHFHKKSYEGEPSYTIPVYENVLAVLFLLRTKEHEYVQEAKRLLQAILQFTLPQKTLPVFLHEYPKPMGDVPSLFLLAALWMIRQDFSLILGEPLLAKLDEVVCALLETSRTKDTLKQYRPLLDVIEALNGGQRKEISLPSRWRDVRFGTLFLLFLERGGEQFESQASELFSCLSSLWTRDWSKGTPYGSNLFFNGHEPVLSLFDYYLSFSFGEMPRGQSLMPYFLDIAWINPSFIKEREIVRQRTVLDQVAFPISLPQLEVRALLFHPKSHELFGFHPLVMISKRFSSVMHFPKAPLVSAESHDRAALFLIQGFPDEEETSLFQLYIEDKPGLVHFLSARGQKASYWNQEKDVFLSFDGLRLKISVDTKAPFHFHLLKRDRPSQLRPSHEGSDWLLEARVSKGGREASWNVSIEVLP